jgi:hypothetical protein
MVVGVERPGDLELALVVHTLDRVGLGTTACEGGEEQAGEDGDDGDDDEEFDEGERVWGPGGGSLHGTHHTYAYHVSH